MSKQEGKQTDHKPVVLRFIAGAHGASTFVEWEESLYYSMLDEYADFGTFVRTLVHYEPPMPATPRAAGADMDALEAEGAKVIYLDDLKARNRLMASWRSKRTSAYSKVRATLGEDILSLLKSLEKYDAMEAACNPLTLFMAAKEVVMAGTSGSRMLDQERCQATFNALQMGAMTLIEFEKEFDKLVTFMKCAEVTPQLAPKDLALKYILKLGPAYNELKLTLENELGFGRDVYPKTMAAAHKLAQNFKVKAPSSLVMPIYSGHLSDGDEHSEQEFLYVAHPNPAYKGRKPRKDSDKPLVRFTDVSSAAKETSKAPAELKIPAELKLTQVKTLEDGDKRLCHETHCKMGGHLLVDCNVRRWKTSKREQHGKDVVFVGQLSYMATLEDAGRNDADYAYAQGPLEPYEVGLDTMAGVSVFSNDALLKDVLRDQRGLTLMGVGGTSDVTHRGSVVGIEGMAAWRGPSGMPNILSFLELAKIAKITWDQDKLSFSAVIGGKTYTWAAKGKVFVCDMSSLVHEGREYALNIETADANRQLYSKQQVAGADLAADLFAKMATPAEKDLVHMVSNGDILNCPVTKQDVERARDIYGRRLVQIRGATKRRKQHRVREDLRKVVVQTHIDMWLDIMFMDGLPALISVSGPMRKIHLTWLKSRAYSHVMPAVLDHIQQLRAGGFSVTAIHSDGEGAIAKMAKDLPLGVILVPRAKEEHVSEIEPKIRQVKERVRGIMSVMPYALGSVLLCWLVCYVVSRLNWVYTTVGSEKISANVVTLGRKLNYETDLALQFGEYVEIHEHDRITNTTAARTEAAIALMPSGSVQGTWWFLKLGNMRPVKRERWTALPMPSNVVAMLNLQAARTRAGGSEPNFSFEGHDVAAEDRTADEMIARGPADGPVRAIGELTAVHARDEGVDSSDGNVLTEEVTAARTPLPTVSSTYQSVVSSSLDEGIVNASEVQDRSPSRLGVRSPTVASSGVPEGTTSTVDETLDAHVGELFGGDSWESTADHPPVPLEESVAANVQGYMQLRARTARNIGDKPMRWEERKAEYLMRISIKKAVESFGSRAVDSMTKELVGIHKAKCWTPIKQQLLSLHQKKKVIRSFMFLKEKFDSGGAFEKLKARLVAGGNMQDRHEYSKADTSSPTACLSSLYLVAGIAARERRSVATVDVGQAFLKAKLEREVIMSLEPKLATMLADELPEYRPFVNADGTLLLSLEKALYGLVESSKLWYDVITGFLIGIGFKANAKERCVLNLAHCGSQLSVVVYVDDLLITCADAVGVDWLIGQLRERFVDITVCKGKKHSYLGQTFDFTVPGSVAVNMEGYTEDLLGMRATEKSAVTPALEGLFEVDGTSPLLPERAAADFHSIVAKAFYLAQRARPDLLTTAAFLTTRVGQPTVQDDEKLSRMLRYLHGTKEMGIRLGKGGPGPMLVTAYVDASYGVHSDFKSHTGVVITAGQGPMYVGSRKQKVVSKSELIGISDALSQVIWTRDFLIEQGYEVGPARLQQDNQSTMVLANKGISTSEKTRHIGIRFFWVKDRIESGEVAIVYLPTEEMVADIMTKPLQGALFRKMRSLLMQWD